jgi:hypothetical protein
MRPCRCALYGLDLDASRHGFNELSVHCGKVAPSDILLIMTVRLERVFKTAWFTKASKKARITDDELCSAVGQVMLGQADDLGGGVFKKRLSKNQYRSIILARGRRYWVYTYLFAKQDRANIEDNELMSFRELAALYARKTADDLAKEMQLKEIVEICHETQSQV